MIPVQTLAFEQYRGEYRKDNKRHHLLNNLQLHQRKWAAIADEPDAIGWNLERILKKSY